MSRPKILPRDITVRTRVCQTDLVSVSFNTAVVMITTLHGVFQRHNYTWNGPRSNIGWPISPIYRRKKRVGSRKWPIDWVDSKCDIVLGSNLHVVFGGPTLQALGQLPSFRATFSRGSYACQDISVHVLGVGRLVRRKQWIYPFWA